MLKASNLHYEMAERTAAMNCGGIGASHLMVQRLGLIEDIDKYLQLLKVHLPYNSCWKDFFATWERLERFSTG